jgi:hypothetical protein
MKRRFIGILAILSIAGILVAAGVAAQSKKQGQVSTSLATAQQPQVDAASQGQIISGANVGIRIIGQQDDKVIGTLVVKVGSEWKDVTLPSTAIGH